MPLNYFGNCLGGGIAKIKHKTLVGEEGFVIAAEAIALDIKNRVNNKDEVLKGVENWMSDSEKFVGMRTVGVSGSPKFDLCDAEFGLGRARKLEVVSIDGEKMNIKQDKTRRKLSLVLHTEVEDEN
ncbi:PREDICTED: malonyl-coenzyme:anthocyanin 5-O-glucoside-6'''-O-malonyltransferase-like [Erythranthe guttata]|uniref:malonyl-coenzyme:anthocyanin 5-O-glucoside-6'''-O-malonyltransferase-like n=1 Tax=Erythranthe guttata TaxID=4155 RepID=UPI00064E0FF2|nr:PREDICTED: malonyl-coenzyme:anthocyanin 5-O-glucoside-6'''-O-malonyltransferase-like [Erythranthe guttata]|eukprot:XP_012849895.1 PREDICTED: malonyl-coenzyme:anthocyanin 5-O-glucoside-6'''-O-malonyltransferase-like [Erythranthe guttata]